MYSVLVPGVVGLLLVCLSVAGCTTEEVTGAAFASAKSACRLNPAQCTVHPDAQ